MLRVGDRFPEYSLQAVVSTETAEAFQTIDPRSFPGRWTLYVFYPKDFTFVCPTELKGFGDLVEEFRDRDVQLLGVSTDSEFVHLAWRRHHDDLRELPYPLVSDIRRDLSGALGVLDDVERVCQRATYVVDPEGVIRYAEMSDPSVGRNPQEVLRVIDALQTGELCPCNWKAGEQTLQPA